MLGMAPDLNKVKNSAASIFEILDSKPKRESSNAGGSTIDIVRGDLEFQNVNFKYPTRPNIQIFTDLCLGIPSGKVYLSAASRLFIFITIVYLSIYPQPKLS